MKIAYLIGLFLLGIGLVVWIYRKGIWKQPKQNKLAPEQRKILLDYVDFYERLDAEKKELFEYKALEFLENITITGIKTVITETDRLLIASSAIIPILSFPKWQYKNLNEVLLYPNSFSEDYALEGKNRVILGMVGTGPMERKMILSKASLLQGFKNEKDKNNTAIHEFIHLIDKADGITDGIPSILLQKQYILPWLDLIEKNISEIQEGNSDIRPYGGTSRIEFFAVLGEYFFEHPKQLERKHPELFHLLEKTFNPSIIS